MNLLDHYSQVYFADDLSCEDAKARYQARRKALGDACGCPYVVTGIGHELGHPYPWATVYTPYFQDPLFQFLTGINQPNCALFVDVKRDVYILFAEPKDPKKEFWDGARLGGGAAESESDIFQLTGLTFKPISQLESIILAYVAEHHLSEIATFWHEKFSDQTPILDHHFSFYTALQSSFQKQGMQVQLTNLSPFQWTQRLCLDAIDLGLFRKANTLTLEALRIVEAQLPFLQTELEICGLLQGELLKRSAKGQSFYPIVASGSNAAVLHYHKNDAVLTPNSLILIDCGLRYQSMPADITRTYAITGQFSPLQALLHGIVLDTQTAVQNAVKEGVTIATLNKVCWTTMDALLEERFLSKGGRMERPYETAPHNVSHLIGLAVHDGDPYRNYKDLPLKSGMVISNEPGLYGRFQMTIEGVSYDEALGIRIEDDLAVTPFGCENLTRNASSLKN